MDQKLFEDVDVYVTDRLVPSDDALEQGQKDAAAAGLPAISVSKAQGKMLSLYATMIGARRILEIGTLAGYSTMWLGWALPVGGKIVTLEYDPKHAKVAQANLARAGLAESVDIRVGKALETLPKLAAENQAPFDMFFIDANKDAIPEYFQWALKLGRKGSLIIVDNVVRGGKILDAASTDANVQGVRRFYDMLAKEPRVSATAIQTVGSKGYDGFALAVVVG